MERSTDVIIVGGGLSGLALADHLEQAGIAYLILEARDRLGGRIKVGEYNDSFVDLGPSWFWPGQYRIADAVKRFGLKQFNQYAAGTLSFEDQNGEVHRNMGYASMEGSYRVKGGMTSVIKAYAGALDETKIITDAPVKTARLTNGVEVVLENGTVVKGQKLVLAIPPRVASNIVYEPALSVPEIQALQAIPTWMGGQAKFVAVYDEPFWRKEGLSGDAMSRHGPMVEIHDASDMQTETGALFGFVGVPVHVRKGHNEDVAQAALQQLGRLFGEKALKPAKVFYQDWAEEPETSSEMDANPLGGHPSYGLPYALSNLWDGRLMLGSTETASQFGGFIEGALERAEQLANEIVADRNV
ncbi:NAD(P)-binding protein [Amylibacter sp. SFDW26]|uniref:flavin monoamine oxidase family protein n=1 Tax=Amylibacter sp. SFDW26 TaxID=2652722 RepID=UPI0012617DF0|nr:FAD-dependent oxidoreductase [Amylibacter sp. SFDW26]KAB7615206.1 NAD(P)-binding protein [Amylibacter sp. SFDW26]